MSIMSIPVLRQHCAPSQHHMVLTTRTEANPIKSVLSPHNATTVCVNLLAFGIVPCLTWHDPVRGYGSNHRGREQSVSAQHVGTRFVDYQILSCGPNWLSTGGLARWLEFVVEILDRSMLFRLVLGWGMELMVSGR